jgi:hypothetical protein
LRPQHCKKKFLTNYTNTHKGNKFIVFYVYYYLILIKISNKFFYSAWSVIQQFRRSMSSFCAARSLIFGARMNPSLGILSTTDKWGNFCYLTFHWTLAYVNILRQPMVTEVWRHLMWRIFRPKSQLLIKIVRNNIFAQSVGCRFLHCAH